VRIDKRREKSRLCLSPSLSLYFLLHRVSCRESVIASSLDFIFQRLVDLFVFKATKKNQKCFSNLKEKNSISATTHALYSTLWWAEEKMTRKKKTGGAEPNSQAAKCWWTTEWPSGESRKKSSFTAKKFLAAVGKTGVGSNLAASGIFFRDAAKS
jgi:hypothetical protein